MGHNDIELKQSYRFHEHNEKYYDKDRPVRHKSVIMWTPR